MSVLGPFLGFVAVLGFCFAWIAVAHRLRRASRLIAKAPYKQPTHVRLVPAQRQEHRR